MSQRSYNSVAHDKRIANHRVTDDDLFECVHISAVNIFTSWVIQFPSYVLRVAWDAFDWYSRLFFDNLPYSLLRYLMAPKVLDSPKAADTREHSSRLSALSNFSLGDMFRDVRDGSKSTKFPEKLLKVLEQKLQDIAMGQDPACVSYLNPLYRESIQLIPSIPDTLINLFGAPWANSTASSWSTVSNDKWKKTAR